MHVDYWKLEYCPFSRQLDVDDYYPSLIHEEAWARMDFLIGNARRVGFLLGTGGTGKSLMLEQAARQLRRDNAQVAKLNVVGLEPREFVWKLAAGIGYMTHTEASQVECWQGICDHLIANRYQRTSTVVLLDDADEASPQIASSISRLALLDPHPSSPLTLLLSGQRQRMRILGPKLNDLCELRIDLLPWDEEETANYLHDAVERAGATREIFQDEATRAVFELTNGIPRRIRQLAELSLLAGAADDAQTIDEELVRSVADTITADSFAEAA